MIRNYILKVQFFLVLVIFKVWGATFHSVVA